MFKVSHSLTCIRRAAAWSHMRRLYFRLVHGSRPPHDVTCRPSGLRLKLRSDSVLAEPLFVGDGFEQGETRLVEQLAQPGMTALDVGANIGLYAVLLGRAVGPSGRVLAVEPYAPVAAYLKENVRANGLTNVRVIEAALDDHCGTASLHVFPAGSDVYNSLGACRREQEGLRAVSTVPVPVWTMDRLVHEAGLDRVDFVKLDVEGAEERVLRGAASTLKNNPKIKVLAELYEPSALQCGCSVRRLIDWMVGLGFRVYQIEKQGTVREATESDFMLRWATYALFQRG